MRTDVRMLQQYVQFVAHDNQSHFITRIDHEHNALARSEVVLPQVAIATGAGHVEGCEANALIWGAYATEFCGNSFANRMVRKIPPTLKSLHGESDRRHRHRALLVRMLEVIDDRRFAAVVQANDQYADLLLANLQHAGQSVEESHFANIAVVCVQIPIFSDTNGSGLGSFGLLTQIANICYMFVPFRMHAGPANFVVAITKQITI